MFGTIREKLKLTLINASDSGIKAAADASGNSLKVKLTSDKGFTVDKVKVEFDYKFDKSDRIYVNGYQSWTDSIEYAATDAMYMPKKLMELVLDSFIGDKSAMINVGDKRIISIPHKNGLFYGFSYGYVRKGDEVSVFGSLSERAGYTIFVFDVNNDKIEIYVDLEGKEFAVGTTEVMNVVNCTGSYDQAFDGYFAAMGIAPKKNKILTGYTTWYNYYGNITQEIAERDLESIGKLERKIDIFQIDDGYQVAIGDWTNCVKEKFPDGMKYVADRIHEKNMLAGLWLAPFAVTKNCFIYKEHKDWLIKGANGKPFKSGGNWGGFYNLDIYNPDARAYIQKVFDIVLRDWGYDLVKLDFLYGECIIPMHGKSRGEIMCEAMDFLRECCGDKLILGCGVPLAPAFGKVDYCRIGPDMGLKWGKKGMDTREGVSTAHALLNSIFRRHLDGRAFGNDPDVFLLRDNNISINKEGKEIIARVNKLSGKVLFISDNISDYDAKKTETLKYIFNGAECKILNATFDNGKVKVIYEVEGEDRNSLEVDVYNTGLYSC